MCIRCNQIYEQTVYCLVSRPLVSQHCSQSRLPLQNLTYEIILTLGQAFEVAYQLALQAQRTKKQQGMPGGAGAEVIETKTSRPVPKPRVSMRKSGVSVREDKQLTRANGFDQAATDTPF